MKFARYALIVAALALAGCPPHDDDAAPQQAPVAEAQGQHAVPCVYCADVSGRPDTKHLCPASAVAWDALVACVCETSCSAPCGSDWCARLDDPHYTNASDECNGCAVAMCYPELSACSSAQ